MKLIGKEVKITDKSSIHYGDWGIVTDFDGEYFFVAIFGDERSQPIFARNEFRVKRGK